MLPDGPTDPSSDPLASYRAAEGEHAATVDALRGDIARVEGGRIASFLVATVVGLLYADLPIGAAASLTISAVAGVVFVVLVVRHRALRSVYERARVGRTLAALGPLRIAREWEAIGERLEELGDRGPLLERQTDRYVEHSYANDLDLFGPASLCALLGPTHSPRGADTLREWLLDPAPPEVVAERQHAVRELAVRSDDRNELTVESALVRPVPGRDWGRFLQWLDEPALFGAALPDWSRWIAWVLPAVTWTLAALDYGTGLAVPTWSWGGLLLVQAVLAWRWGQALGGYFGRATGDGAKLGRYGPLLSRWERLEVSAPLLARLTGRLAGDAGIPASEEVRRLGRWIDTADGRTSWLYAFIAWGFLTDIHLAAGLENWRARTGSRVEAWFDALGALESLTALAVLSHDNPTWAWPELTDDVQRFEAEELGHPLLAPAVMRPSDVALDPPGRFLLVTGSNMSGKSTLLRSIGLGAVLAQAGGPVCARRLALPPARVFTSMRIQDSLTDGVSLFMAELNRLKALVDAAHEDGDGAPLLLYLIDEVLQGTNSEERRVAARRIVTHLLGERAVGAVTTHDLALHLEDGLDEAATKVHFREQVGGGEGSAVLTFDYKLRPGLATSRNALKLLQIVGLGRRHETFEFDFGIRVVTARRAARRRRFAPGARRR